VHAAAQQAEVDGDLEQASRDPVRGRVAPGVLLIAPACATRRGSRELLGAEPEAPVIGREQPALQEVSKQDLVRVMCHRNRGRQVSREVGLGQLDQWSIARGGVEAAG